MVCLDTHLEPLLARTRREEELLTVLNRYEDVFETMDKERRTGDGANFLEGVPSIRYGTSQYIYNHTTFQILHDVLDAEEGGDEH